MSLDPNARESVRNFFCVLAILALVAFALKVAFPYGPPGPSYSGEITNPFYLAMPWYESMWQFCVGGALVGAAFSVIFTMMALSSEKEQTRYLHEQMRKLLAGEIQYFGGSPRTLR